MPGCSFLRFLSIFGNVGIYDWSLPRCISLRVVKWLTPYIGCNTIIKQNISWRKGREMLHFFPFICQF